MYSVLRVTSENISKDFLDEIGNQMNSLVANTYEGIRKKEDGFSCEISKSDLWFDQIKEVSKFLNIFKDQIKTLRANGYGATIDIAVFPNEFKPQNYGFFLFHNSDFLQLLVDTGVEYEMSIYKGENW
jgi:predicted MPP superfamily phosphohydrolase